MKSKKVKGSITVFSLIVLTAYIVFVSSLLDLYRYSSAGASYKALILSSTKTMRQLCDTEVMSRYGFGICGVDSKELHAKYYTMIKKLDEKNTDMETESLLMAYNHALESADTPVDAMQNRITDMTRETVSTSELNAIADSHDAFDSTSDTLKSCYGKVSAIVDNTDIPALKNTSAFDFVKKCIGSEKTDIASKERFDQRQSALRCNSWDKSNWASQQATRYDDRTLLDSCQKGLSYMYDCICDKAWFRSGDTVYSHSDSSGFESGLYSCAGYMDKYFQTQLNDQGIKTKAAEYEYVLFGHQSNYDNKLYTAQRIFEMRLAYDLCAVSDEMFKSSDGDKNAILKAVSEAKLDTAIILAGKKVKLIKSKSDFRTNKDMSDSDILSLAQSSSSFENGICYQDHLRFLLFHTTSYEMMYTRVIDAVGFGIGKELRSAITSVEIKVVSNYKLTNISLAGMMLKGKKNEVKTEIRF